MFSIGEFSKITSLSVKTLRFYHEKGLLVPTCVDKSSGYRYYDRQNVEKARVIVRLRDMQFSLQEIAGILEDCDDEGDILEHLQRKRQALHTRIREEKGIVLSLDRIIAQESEVRRVMQNANFEVEEKVLDTMLIAGVRMRGKYCECGKGFAKIGRSLGRFICGKPFLLHYDDEYREDDADFEACMPIRKEKQVDGIAIRELPGGRAVSLMHKGPYDQLGTSYCRILDYAKQHGYHVVLPTREVYLKGPGMIFKGNPQKYLTEIQMVIKE